MARIVSPLALSSGQRTYLGRLLQQGTLEQRVGARCRVLLLAAEGWSNVDIAGKLDLHRNGVAKIRGRFAQHGLGCLEDAKRSGKPATHLPATKQKIVATVCGRPPKGLSRWSARSLAAKLGLSKSFVHGVLLEHDLHPHRLRTFNFSPDPQFEEKLLEVVGLYMNPPHNALVLCMDEKTGIQALDRTQPVLPLRAGKPRLWSNEYVRHGTQTMLAAVDIESGRATTWVNKTRRSADFVTFMNQVVQAYPGQRLHVVMDNLNTHKGAMATDWLQQHPLVSFHFTPTHASWVNLAECFFSILTRKGLQQAVHRSNRELVRFLKDFVEQYNKTCGPYLWTKGPEKLKKIIALTKSFQTQMNKH
jgi:transposase